MRKKILSMLLAVVMLASVCSMMIVPVGADTGASKNFYVDSADNTKWHIVNQDGLKEFRNAYRAAYANNTTATYKTVVLDKDITMTEDWLWTTATKEYSGFVGTFDGQGHTIYNLVLTTNRNNGLLGTIYSATETLVATVQNVALVNAKITMPANTDTYNCEGLFYGQVSGKVTFNNVYIKASIVATGDAVTGVQTNAMGALIGNVNAGTTISVSNSVFNVSTKGSTAPSERSGALIGGWAGDGSQLTVNTCALYSDELNFGYSYYFIGSGFGGGGTDNALKSCKPAFSPTNFVTDVTISGQRAGLITGLNMYDSKAGHLTEQDVYGFDAKDVDGFTKTAGHLMPSELLKMFPQHCLEENAVEGGILKLQGYQTKGNDIRLVATIADKTLEGYKALGFEVVVAYGGSVASQDVEKKEVYSSICANSETGDDEISAGELIGGDGYIFALHFHPTHTPDAVTFQVRTYYIDANDNRTYGSTEVFTVTEFPDGTVVGGQLS